MSGPAVSLRPDDVRALTRIERRGVAKRSEAAALGIRRGIV